MGDDREFLVLWDYLKSEAERLLEKVDVDQYQIVAESEKAKGVPPSAFCATSVEEAVLYRDDEGKWGVDLFFAPHAVAQGMPPVIGTPRGSALPTKQDALNFGVQLAIALVANDLRCPSEGLVH